MYIITMQSITFSVVMLLSACFGALVQPVIFGNWFSFKSGVKVFAVLHLVMALVGYFIAGQELVTPVLLLVLYGAVEALIAIIVNIHTYEKEHGSSY